MERIMMPKSAVAGFLGALLPHHRVVAPVRDGALTEFRRIGSGGEAELSDRLPPKSPKEFLFPPAEAVLEYGADGGVTARSTAQKTVIFGVRPCDLYAIKVLDAVFGGGKYVDPAFYAHREATLLLGLGCLAEKPGCFCGERGLNRGYSPDCDAFFTVLGEECAVDAPTEAGRALLRRFLPDAERSEIPVPAARAGGAALELDADENELFEKIDWARVSETCLGCGACTYLCPTCHCFEFKDVKKGESALRYRCWDSCMYPKFTLHASGHNPRATKVERYRQRVLHKFLYVKRNSGLTACGGCGRCVRGCPSGMDIRRVVRGIMEGLRC